MDKISSVLTSKVSDAPLIRKEKQGLELLCVELNNRLSNYKVPYAAVAYYTIIADKSPEQITTDFVVWYSSVLVTQKTDHLEMSSCDQQVGSDIKDVIPLNGLITIAAEGSREKIFSGHKWNEKKDFRCKFSGEEHHDRVQPGYSRR